MLASGLTPSLRSFKGTSGLELKATLFERPMLFIYIEKGASREISFKLRVQPTSIMSKIKN